MNHPTNQTTNVGMFKHPMLGYVMLTHAKVISSFQKAGQLRYIFQSFSENHYPNVRKWGVPTNPLVYHVPNWTYWNGHKLGYPPIFRLTLMNSSPLATSPAHTDCHSCTMAAVLELRALPSAVASHHQRCFMWTNSQNTSMIFVS